MANPIFFKTSKTILPEHIDELGHVNNVVFIGFIQEVSILDWQHKVPENIIEQIRWVVKRHEIDYISPAFLGEIIQIKTWVEEFKGLSSIRYVEMSRAGQSILKSKTTWVALDAKTLQLKRYDFNLNQFFFEP